MDLICAQGARWERQREPGGFERVRLVGSRRILRTRRDETVQERKLARVALRGDVAPPQRAEFVS
jgi:hypothetical protein